MLPRFIFVFLLSSTFPFLGTTYGQQVNVALNGSLEDVIGCPEKPGQIYKAQNYHTVSGQSIDLFTNCGFKNFGMPENGVGYQHASQGISMAGILSHTKGYSYYDYLVGTLDTSKMIDGAEYCLSVKISLADNSPYYVDQLAFFFSPFNNHKNYYTDFGFYSHTLLGMMYATRDYRSTVTSLGKEQELSDSENWMIVKNSIIYHKKYDYFFWIGSNIFEPKVYSPANLNQNTFNPDRTVYYYVDEVKITKVENDTTVIEPDVVINCEDFEYRVTLPDYIDSSVWFYDNKPASFLKHKQEMFDKSFDFDKLKVFGFRDDECSEHVFLFKADHQDLDENLSQFHPNPNIGILQYSMLSPGLGTTIHIDIHSTTGRLVKSFESKLDDGLNQMMFNISDLASGTYIVSRTTNGCLQRQKIVLVK